MVTEGDRFGVTFGVPLPYYHYDKFPFVRGHPTSDLDPARRPSSGSERSEA